MTFSLNQTATQLEAEIRQNRLLNVGVDWQDEIIFPAYNGLSLRNIPHTIADLLGVQLPHHTPLDDRVWGKNKPQAQRVIIAVLDGAGYYQLKAAMERDPAVKDAVERITNNRGAVPLTSVAPSTTAVALTTLWTGATPAATGMMSTTAFLREYGVHTVMLFFKPTGAELPDGSMTSWGMDAGLTVPVKGLPYHLAQQGIESHAILDARFVRSGLSLVLHRDLTHFHGHRNAADYPLTIRRVLRETAGQRAFVNVYWPLIDTMAHHYGVHSEEAHNEILRQLTMFADLLDDPSVQDGQTVVIVTADHGHFDVPNFIELGDDPQAQPVRDAQRHMFTGDERLAHLTLTHRGYDAAVDALKTHYADRMAVIESHEALEKGFYGTEPAMPEATYRVGDVILMPRKTYRVRDAYTDGLPFISAHAGLSDWEMLIPFMWRQI